ncbi:MAG TPA: hypothetical protein VK629_19280 [Steroidobacteraceae bacterium]|nr:hypothetical protein [Steroidobacteraceae bacterium]
MSLLHKSALALLVTIMALPARAHDVTTHVTWNREISRIAFARCVSCHSQSGSAFPLTTYREAQPWSKVIAESVMTRRMPPWGAVKGFGHFRNEEALTQEEIDLFAMWATGGAPEGNPDHLVLRPTIPARAPLAKYSNELIVAGDFQFAQPFMLDGFFVRKSPAGSVAQITLRYPDGRIEPLVWLSGFKARSEPFLLRVPLKLPIGTELRGLNGAEFAMLPANP